MSMHGRQHIKNRGSEPTNKFCAHWIAPAVIRASSSKQNLHLHKGQLMLHKLKTKSLGSI